MIKFVLAFALLLLLAFIADGGMVPDSVGLASLPVLAIGYGVYWLVKRQRK